MYYIKINWNLIRMELWFVRMEFSCNISRKLVNYQKNIYIQKLFSNSPASHETTQNHKAGHKQGDSFA